MRRVLALAALVLAVTGATAQAHGGYVLLEKTAGPYAVTVQADGIQQDGEPAVDLTTFLIRQDLGEPDLAAKVRLRITGPDGTTTLDPKAVGDGYEAIVPGPANAWRDWSVEATVDGPAGRTVVRAAPPPLEKTLSPPAIAGLAAAVLLIAAVSLTARNRRLRAAESTA